LTIPDGLYPVLSPITTSADEATDAGDPAFSCASTEQAVWYTWTPAVTASYSFRTCSAQTATTDGDGVLAIFTSTGGCDGPFTQVACNDDGCRLGDPSLINFMPLTGGVTYYILAAHFPGPSQITQFQIQISKVADVCDGAGDLTPDVPAHGTLGATDDYQSLVAPLRPTMDFASFGAAVAYDLVNYFDAAGDPAQREPRVAVRGRESRAAASGCHSVDGEDA